MPTGSEKILFVEDDDGIRNLFSAFLADQGYDVHTARDGEQGLRVFDRQEGELDLLLTDIVMPKMGGLELAGEMRDSRPELKILFISGYSDQQGTVLEQVGTGVGFSPETVYARRARSQAARRIRCLSRGNPHPGPLPAGRVRRGRRHLRPDFRLAS